MSKNNTQNDNLQQDRQNNLINEFSIFFFSLTKLQRKVFWKLHSMSFREDYYAVFIRQDTLAKLVGCCTRHAHKTIKKLYEAGYLLKLYRHKQSCIYEIPFFLKIPHLKNIVKPNLAKGFHKVQKTPRDHSKITPSKSILVSTYVDIRNTNKDRKTNRSKFDPKIKPRPKPKIKESVSLRFTDAIFTDRDKVQYSRYEDKQIEEVWKVYSNKIEREGIGSIRNHAGFIETMLWRSKNKIVNELYNDLNEFDKEEKSQTINFGRFDWDVGVFKGTSLYVRNEAIGSYIWALSTKKNRLISNHHAYFYEIVKEKKKKLSS